jgi:16S rRNA pseudouridine516 synthase
VKVKLLSIADILYTQGFGSRRLCAGLIENQQVAVAGEVVLEQSEAFDPTNLEFVVDGVTWPFQERAYLMLYKPAGHECSHKPSQWPSVYRLLPDPLRQRPVRGGQDGVQAVGRLDQDTTGLLLFSDDGQFIHKMNSPKHHVPKIYRIVTAEDVSSDQVEQLVSGVSLHEENTQVRAAACRQTGERELTLTLTEGKYHQVKRMVAAAGNHVQGLHREQIGGLRLEPEMQAGQWRWLSADDIALARQASPAQS